MKPISQRIQPLNVLAILSESSCLGIGFLSVFRSDYLLICRSLKQAEQSAPAFRPDVVMVDRSLRLNRQQFLSQCLGSGTTTLVQISADPLDEALVLADENVVAEPASAKDMQNLLNRIRRRIETRPFPAATCA